MTTYTYTQPLASFESNIADSIMGPEVETDHDRPPLGSFVFGPAYDGTMFVIKDNLLYYSKPKQPEYFPALYYIEVSTPQHPLKTGVIHNGQVFVFSDTDAYYIQGTGNGTFLPFKRDAKTGAQSVRGAVAVPGKGIYHVGPDGIYLLGSGSDVKMTEQTLEPIFRGETVEGMAGVESLATSWLWPFGNNLYFGYASSGQGYPGNVLVMNLDTGKVAYYVYNDGSTVQIRAVATDATNKRLLIGDSAGYVRVIESPEYTDDSGTAISFDLKSKDFELQTRSHFPRFVKYDVEATDADSVTGELYLNGESHQTHTITGSRNTKRRLVATGNGQRAAIRISGSGPATIYLTEFE
jgi:hypothetical protein